MNIISMFDVGMPLEEHSDPTLNSFSRGIGNTVRYLQDNIHGYPIYSADVAVLNVYEDAQPQKIQLIEPARAGTLLNIHAPEAGRQELLARIATNADPLRYANSIALSAGASGSIIYCAVKIGIVYNLGGAAGPRFLGANGAISTTLGNGKIGQKVGDMDAAGNFMFYFHTPFLYDFTTLERIK